MGITDKTIVKSLTLTRLVFPYQPRPGRGAGVWSDSTYDAPAVLIPAAHSRNQGTVPVACFMAVYDIM